MTPPPDSTVPHLGIPLIAGLVTLAFLGGVGRVRGAKAAVLAALLSAGWWGLTGGLAAAGLLGRFDARPPPMAVMIGVVLSLGVGLGLSRVGGALRELSMGTLVLAQGFRLPLELVMHRAATDGVMPPELSYGGLNFDVLTGSTALVVGGLALAGKAPRPLLWAWNLLGVAALSMIVFIAVATSPMVRLFGDDPRHVNTWVTFVPYVWLPTVLVVAAIAGHVVVTRKLLAERAGA